MQEQTKKVFLVSVYYLIALFALSWVVIYFLPRKDVLVSLPLFYVFSFILAVISGYYLFFAESSDIHNKKGKLSDPYRKDVSKRKVLLISFVYSCAFLLMFLYPEVSLFVFALWPVMVFLSLLLLFDRRLIFSVKDTGANTDNLQKYGARVLFTIATLSSMWFLLEFLSRRPLPLSSQFFSGWEFIDIIIWTFPIPMISGLIVADWVTTAIKHGENKNFFKRADVVLFYGIQLLIMLFLVVA